MPIEEIEKTELSSFLMSFSRQHYNWLVTVELVEKSGNKQMVAENAPLQQIAFGENDSVEIVTLANQISQEQNYFTAQEVQKVCIDKTEKNEHKGLQIWSIDGSVLHIKFRSTVLPEMLNGIKST